MIRSGVAVPAPESQPSSLSPGTILGGKFRVIRTLGVGGMGSVYEVQHELTRHRRALKLLHADVRQKHPHVVQRFLREASVAGTLGDPHIVETFDAGELPTGEPYLVMELLQGEPLSDRIARGRLPIGEAASIGAQLCEAISVAHARGIIHRDLKPENVFLCAPNVKPSVARHDEAAFVKVLDFGISKFDSSFTTDGAAQTQEGIALGTPFYMPPEQVRGSKDIDARSDVYAIGVILYEGLTGQRPFDADSMPHLMVLIHEGRYTPLRALRPDAPEELAALIDRAMAKDPDARIQSAKELGERLAPFLGVTSASSPPTIDIALDATHVGGSYLGSTPPPKGDSTTPRDVVSAGVSSVQPLGKTEFATVQNTGASSSVSLEAPAPKRAPSRGLIAAAIVSVLVVVGGIAVLALPAKGTREKASNDGAHAAPAADSRAPTPGSPVTSVSITSAPVASATPPPMSSTSPTASVNAGLGAVSIGKPAAPIHANPVGTPDKPPAKPSASAKAKPLPSGLATNPF